MSSTLTGALHAERIGRHGMWIAGDMLVRQIVRSRHRVNHESRGQDLAVLIQDLLPEHLGAALRHAAVTCPFSSSGLMTVPTSSTTR